MNPGGWLISYQITLTLLAVGINQVRMSKEFLIHHFYAYVFHESVTHTVHFSLSLSPTPAGRSTSYQVHQVRMHVFTTSTNHIRTTLSILWMIVITFLFMNTCGVPLVIHAGPPGEIIHKTTIHSFCNITHLK